MVSITKLLIALLVILPCLLAQTDAKKAACTITVSQQLTDSSSKYNTYSATVTNTGATSVSSIALTPSATVRSVTGLTSSGDSYSPSVDSIAPSGTYSFSFTVKKSSTVKWTATCTASSSTAAPTTTKAPKTTTTAAPKATTTKAAKATTTAAPKATTTTAPIKATTTTAPKTTTKATTTNAPVKATTTLAPANTGNDDGGDGAVGAAGGKKCGSGWWRPAPLTTWQWQLTGTIDTSVDVQMYDIDLFDASASLISTLHGQGRVVICYFSTQYENWRPDASSWPANVLGSNLDDWVGEKYVDIRATAVRNIMGTRLDLAVSKGCDGVEPDNVDGYTASSGFPLTANDQLDFNKFIASAAHSRGLSVGLKNDPDQAAALQPYFDWALNEQCNQYSECTSLNSFINAGKAVFNCEYSGSATSVCPKMVSAKFSTIFKALALEAAIKTQCCTYNTGGCATKAASTCVTAKRSLMEEQAAEAVVEEEEEVLEEVQEEPVATQDDEELAMDSKMNSAATAGVSIITLAGAVAALSLLL